MPVTGRLFCICIPNALYEVQGFSHTHTNTHTHASRRFPEIPLLSASQIKEAQSLFYRQHSHRGAEAVERSLLDRAYDVARGSRLLPYLPNANYGLRKPAQSACHYGR
jgi:hypothetical protein